MAISFQLIFSFLASGFCSVMSNIQKHYFILTGFLGMSTWLIAHLLGQLKLSTALSALLASIYLAFISSLLSHYLPVPSAVLHSSGMITIVPGGTLYQAILAIEKNNVQDFVSDLSQALLIAGAIAIGFMINSFFSSLLKRVNQQLSR